MNQTRSNLIIISLLAISTIACLKHSSNADTPIPQRLVAHEFDLADTSGKIIGTIGVTKYNEPKLVLNDNVNGNAGSLLLELTHGNPVMECTSTSKDNGAVTLIACNKVRSAIIFAKSDVKTGKINMTLLGANSGKVQTAKFKPGSSSMNLLLNRGNKSIKIGSSEDSSSVPEDCPNGYHYECLICPNGRFVGDVKDGFHEQDGPNGTYPAPDPKHSK